MSHLSLFLLGSPRIEHDSAPVRIGRRKAVALLAYLAVTANSHSREALATLLWPESEPGRAYAYLRHLLWTLNQTPVAGWLQADGETVDLRRDPDLWSDVDRFRSQLAACQAHGHPAAQVCAACLPLLAEAAELYRGDFMAGFTLAGSAAFDEWQFYEADTLRQELAGALEKLVHFHGEWHELEPAIAYARRWLALDPLNEPVHRQLMALYARSGQRAAARRQYEECRRTLQKELGTAPDKETVDLYQRIRGGELGSVDKRAGVAAPLQNLPVPATPFVGREVERAEIHRLLADPACRLLTLAGLGGSGKTRLAIEAAREWLGQLPGDVFFVPLAPVSAPEFMIPAIADALHAPFSQQGSSGAAVSQRGYEALQSQLLDYLREKQMLLVLDNVEHLLAGVDRIAEILHGAPGVKLLVTSRERLNLHGEWVLEVAGLRYPADGVDPDTLETYGAVQLFIQSARRANVGLSLTTADIAAVGRICRLVEGLPLGIELAAAWAKVISCQEIAAEIENNLDFLTTPLRDVPERHRSLRAVFAQSWAMLSGDGRACFRKLAVFRGGFTREAARDVAGASLDALSSLVDKSLLHRSPAGRYEMLEVLRQYAEERLASVPRESDVVRDRHGEHYLALLHRLEPALKSSGQKAALAQLGQEIGNVRAAWRWATVRDKAAEIQGAALSLFIYYDVRSRFQEGAAMFQEPAVTLGRAAGGAISEPQDADARLALHGMLLAAQGWFLRYTAPAESLALLRRSINILEPLAPCQEQALAYALACFAGLWASRTEQEPRLRKSLGIYESHEDRWGMAMVLEGLSGALFANDLAAAERCAQQSLELRRQIGDTWGITMALYMLGVLAEEQGMFQVAEDRYRESLELRRDLGEDLDGIVGCLGGMGRVAQRMGKYEQARHLYQESLTLSREIGSRYHIANCLAGLGVLDYEEKAYSQARRALEESLALYESLAIGSRTASIVAALGRVALASGAHEEARHYFERSLRLEAGNPWASLGLGQLSATRGDKAESYRHYQQALRQALIGHDEAAALEVLVGTARLRLVDGAPVQAAELAGFILSSPFLSHARRVRTEQLLADVANTLPAELVAAALARGEAGTIVPEDVRNLLAPSKAQGQRRGPRERGHGLPPALPHPPAGQLIEPLSARELEVLQLLAGGLSNKEIAQALVVAVGTVKKHLKNIYGKLGAHSRTDAVAHGRALGLL